MTVKCQPSSFFYALSRHGIWFCLFIPQNVIHNLVTSWRKNSHQKDRKIMIMLPHNYLAVLLPILYKCILRISSLLNYIEMANISFGIQLFVVYLFIYEFLSFSLAFALSLSLCVISENICTHRCVVPPMSISSAGVRCYNKKSS